MYLNACVELIHATLFTHTLLRNHQHTVHITHLDVMAAAEAAEVRHLQVGDNGGAARHHALHAQQLVDVLGVQAAHTRLLLHAVRTHLYSKG
jgi:hypothetical protein